MPTKSKWLCLAAGAVALVTIARVDVDPKAVLVVPPGEIKWVRNSAGTSEQAVLFGDPSKPGPYVKIGRAHV